jgi:hypothetical protein
VLVLLIGLVQTVTKVVLVALLVGLAVTVGFGVVYVINQAGQVGSSSDSASPAPIVLPSATLELTDSPAPVPSQPQTTTPVASPSTSTIPALTPFTPSPTSTPSATPEQSIYRSVNWAGYIVTTDLQNPQPNVTSISATWAIPTITPTSSDSFSAVWIGIGGRYDQTLIQCGTEQLVINGRPTYSAWYELLPANIAKIRFLTVHPGDEITATISLVNDADNRWQIRITDTTTGDSYQNTFIYNTSRLTAEWIVERPKINEEFSTLSNFGNVTFTNCTVTIEVSIGTINTYDFVKAVMYPTAKALNDSERLVDVSDLGADGSTFTVTYQEPHETS